MEIDIDKATLQDIISLIEGGTTEQEICNSKGYKAASTVSNRLKAVGATCEFNGEWNFTKIDPSILTKQFWTISYSKDRSKTTVEGLDLNEQEITTLKKIVEEYIKGNYERETETLKYELFGKLLFEHADYRNKDSLTKQLNVPVQEHVMQRLDDFANTSGLEKKFIVNKAIETFLDLYDGKFQ
ncbi:hypothetical protein [Metabacillus litoralis]|uniref:hypothetical protein n=1 Tax=Metabacillus litoralis TaxID=152268 RepID=UPI00203CC7ED|nr:hypothetical protein [Metabacillus litoralis]MCM3164371.1 hypothetical protein [Metabacillus litoralis]